MLTNAAKGEVKYQSMLTMISLIRRRAVVFVVTLSSIDTGVVPILVPVSSILFLFPMFLVLLSVVMIIAGQHRIVVLG